MEGDVEGTRDPDIRDGEMREEGLTQVYHKLVTCSVMHVARAFSERQRRSVEQNQAHGPGGRLSARPRILPTEARLISHTTIYLSM